MVRRSTYFCACAMVCALLPTSARADPALPAPPPPLPEPPPPWPTPVPSSVGANSSAVVDLSASPAPRSPTAAPPPRLTYDPPGPLAWGPQPLEAGQHFTIDPVADGVLIGGGAAISGLLSLILSTGEIRPSLPGPTSDLLSIDRLAVTQHVDPNAGTYSTIGLGASIVFAAADPFLSAYRDGWDAALVDAVIYAETISLTETLTDITKIAVRRPRPVDYVTCPYNGASLPTNPACQGSTDLQLSFFSGHSATVGSIGATATYLAFQRGGARSARAWITLATSLALTTFVSIERVRAGQHFPTDVIAGSFAGIMVGTLVPHLHKHVQEAPTVWIGFAPAQGGGTATLGGLF
jgi:membrane-associated phospholipid phosphatase